MKTISHIEQVSDTICFAVFVFDDGGPLEMIHQLFTGIDCYADACLFLRDCDRSMSAPG